MKYPNLIDFSQMVPTLRSMIDGDRWDAETFKRFAGATPDRAGHLSNGEEAGRWCRVLRRLMLAHQGTPWAEVTSPDCDVVLGIVTWHCPMCQETQCVCDDEEDSDALEDAERLLDGAMDIEAFGDTDDLDGCISAQDTREFDAYLRGCSDAQVRGVYERETSAGREAYAQLASMEAARRGISL